MNVVENIKHSNISATTAAFQLRGGKYACAAHATWGGGSVKLQRLLPDGSTYLSVASATDFTANGIANVDLAGGLYKWTVDTASAIYTDITRIPT